MSYSHFRSVYFILFFFFFKQKTAYEMRISDWSSDVCSSDLRISSSHFSKQAHFHFDDGPEEQRLDVNAILASPSADTHLYAGSVAKIVKLEHAWRRLDGRNDDGFQVAPFPG